MKKTLKEELTKIFEKDRNVVLLYGDVGFDGISDMEKQYKSRIFNVGIAEQTMVSVVAGMAFSGFKVYVYTVTPFLIERAFEQIKLDINSTKLDVNLIGFTNYNNQGPTHEELNAEKTMSMFENIKSFFPKTKEELISSVLQSYETNTPTFIKVIKI